MLIPVERCTFNFRNAPVFPILYVFQLTFWIWETDRTIGGTGPGLGPILLQGKPGGVENIPCHLHSYLTPPKQNVSPTSLTCCLPVSWTGCTPVCTSSVLSSPSFGHTLFLFTVSGLDGSELEAIESMFILWDVVTWKHLCVLSCISGFSESMIQGHLVCFNSQG